MKARSLRVYGFLENSDGDLLIAYERFQGQPLIKFPGGGIEWGEGHQEALCREFMEELGVSIAVKECVYFNDFPVQSAINPVYQVQSFFYRVALLESEVPQTVQTETIREVPMEEGERFVWVPKTELDGVPFTFEIEQAAIRAYLAAAKNLQ